MKAFNAIYRYGYLYDANTNERILLAEGSQLSVTVDGADLMPADPYNRPTLSVAPEMKVANIKKRGFVEYAVLLQKDEQLFFEISAGIRSKKQERFTCLFGLRLEEDLVGARKEPSKPLELIECNCTVTACLSSNMPFFEPIHAYSLNDAYSKTYDFYFRLYGKPVGNVKLKMMERPHGDPLFLRDRLAYIADLVMIRL